jgi:hypothetical protein
MKAWLCFFFHHTWHRQRDDPGGVVVGARRDGQGAKERVYYVDYTCSRCGAVEIAWERYDTQKHLKGSGRYRTS